MSARQRNCFRVRQARVVGSMGCAFSMVTGNEIHDIHFRQLFSGAEMAGIKFHGAVDVVIGNSYINIANKNSHCDTVFTLCKSTCYIKLKRSLTTFGTIDNQ